MGKEKFLHEDFLLSTEPARDLYHTYASKLPIIDYHCHISPKAIAEDWQFDNMTQVWLYEDHYKWRQMRSNGVEEKYITGDATDYEKFCKWAQTLEKAIGNPLYHWSHMELWRYIGYDGALNGGTAKKVWKLCEERLAQEDMSVRGIIRASDVKLMCTTDDPVDNLCWHRAIAEDDTIEFKVLPTWRPDRALSIEKQDFVNYMAELSAASDIAIENFDDWKEALKKRMDYFAQMGCVISDHGLLYVPWEPAKEAEVARIFCARLQGEKISRKEELKFKTKALLWLGRQYQKRGWVMQLHFGVLRDINPTLYEAIGEDAGGDAMGDAPCGERLAGFLKSLERKKALPKMILYSINPGDNAVIDTLAGCFENGEARGKLQHGCAWWFNDTKIGMEAHLQTLASLSVLGSFVGMLTDSRSFLSYTRHDYFRRILCNYVGGLVDRGEYPRDYRRLERIIRGICYENAKVYFDL